jgi:hypothetical protein
MEKLLFALFCVIFFASCGNKSEGSTKGTTTATATIDCNKMKEEAKAFEAQQAARWAAVKENFKKDSSKYGGVQAWYNKWNNKYVPFLTGEMDQIFAQYYITEFKANMPETERKTIGGREVDVKRTESVWVERAAILAFAQQLATNADIDGIRLYFAQYPTNAHELDPKLLAEVDGRRTILFTLTKPDGANHKDFFYRPGTGTAGIYIYDYNGLCPDICIGATLGGY